MHLVQFNNYQYNKLTNQGDSGGQVLYSTKYQYILNRIPVHSGELIIYERNLARELHMPVSLSADFAMGPSSCAIKSRRIKLCRLATRPRGKRST